MDQLTAQSIKALQSQSKKSEINMEEAIQQLNEAQVKREKKHEAKEKAEKAKKVALEEVKKTQSKAVQVVKNAVTK